MVASRRFLWLALGGAAIGALAWSGSFYTLPLALVLPSLWAAAESRLAGGVVVLAYQLAATHGAPVGIALYYHTLFASGVLLWLIAAIIIAAAWMLCWRKTRKARIGMLPVAFVITALPPFGIVGWVHPITAAGSLFPGFAWAGLLLAMVLAAGVAFLPLRFTPAVACALVLFAVLVDRPLASPAGWQGVDTDYPFGESMDIQRDYDHQRALIETASAVSARIVVFPESAGGRWNRTREGLWTNGLSHSAPRTVLLGAAVSEQDGSSTNALVKIDAHGNAVVYRQRMPVPVSMWRPWSAKGTRAYWFGNPVVTIEGTPCAVLICNEQALVWPVLHSFTHNPRLLVGCANAWWCADRSIPRIEYNSITAWSRLFGCPCITATNF